MSWRSQTIPANSRILPKTYIAEQQKGRESVSYPETCAYNVQVHRFTVMSTIHLVLGRLSLGPASDLLYVTVLEKKRRHHCQPMSALTVALACHRRLCY